MFQQFAPPTNSNAPSRTLSQKAWDWVFPKGVQKKDFILPLFTVLLMSLVAFETYQIFQSQKYDSDLVNVSGQQRMLLQQYYREMSQSQPDQIRSQQTLSSFLENARVLRYGGRMAIPGDQESWLRVELNQEPEIQAHLEKQIKFAEDLLLARPEKFNDEKAIGEAMANVNATVQHYVEAAQIHIKNFALFTVSLSFVLGVLGLFLSRLIVERRKQFRELSLAKETAIHASKAKTQFLANMSHEIRTPLNAIIGMTDILQGTNLSSDQSRFVKTLRRAGDTLLSLISDILDLSKIESGQAELDTKELDLIHLVDRLCELMALRAHQKNLELTCYVSPDVPTYILGDETKLRQVLMNLLSNAVKFTNAGEINLRIDYEAANGQKPALRFSVSDTGIGVAEEKFASIFDNFTQADSSISVDYGGTGLGLAISKRLVELMGGKIWLKSNLGIGSTFYFEIPFQRASRKKEEELSLEALTGKRILVVDDNETNRFIIHKYLEKAAVTIHEANSGMEAIARLDRANSRGEPYDIILLDFRMPGLNGIDVATKIRQNSLAREAIIMLLTSDGRGSEPGRLYELGISEFMIKPIRRRDFLETLLRNIDGFKQTQKAKVPDAQPTAQLKGDGKRILIVDDVEDNRFVVATYLMGTGFQVDEAESGEQALALCRKNSYDLIFMDMRMSPMDGCEATMAIRKLEKDSDRPPAVVLALTAHAMKHEIENAIQCGCNGHVLKPVTKDRIFEVVRSFLIKGDPVLHQEKNRVSTPVADSQGPVIPQLDEFLKPRLPAYLKSLQDKLNLIPQWMDAKDFEGTARFAHNTSGTAGMYTLEDLGQLSHQLEQAAKSQNSNEVLKMAERMRHYLSRIQVD